MTSWYTNGESLPLPICHPDESERLAVYPEEIPPNTCQMASSMCYSNNRTLYIIRYNVNFSETFIAVNWKCFSFSFFLTIFPHIQLSRHTPISLTPHLMLPYIRVCPFLPPGQIHQMQGECGRWFLLCFGFQSSLNNTTLCLRTC